MDAKRIGPLLRVVQKEFNQLHREKAQSMGLTPPQFFAVHYLSRHQTEEICQRDIERNFDLSHATVSGVINRLEKKGFIECEVSENDKRYKKIVLTDKAKKFEDEMGTYIGEYEDQLMKGFSEEEKDLLRNFLIRMLGNMDVDLPVSFREETEK